MIRQFQSKKYANSNNNNSDDAAAAAPAPPEAASEVQMYCAVMCDWEKHKAEVQASNEALYRVIDQACTALAHNVAFDWKAHTPCVYLTNLSLKMCSVAMRRFAEQGGVGGGEASAAKILRDNFVDEMDANRLVEFLCTRETDYDSMPLVFIFSTIDKRALPLVATYLRE